MSSPIVNSRNGKPRIFVDHNPPPPNFAVTGQYISITLTSSGSVGKSRDGYLKAFACQGDSTVLFLHSNHRIPCLERLRKECCTRPLRTMESGKHEHDEEEQAFLDHAGISPKPQSSRRTATGWWRLLLELAMAITIVLLLFFPPFPPRNTIRRSPVPQRTFLLLKMCRQQQC